MLVAVPCAEARGVRVLTRHRHEDEHCENEQTAAHGLLPLKERGGSTAENREASYDKGTKSRLIQMIQVSAAC